MLKTLIFAGMAAYAGKKLHESGALDDFIADVKARFNTTGAQAQNQPVSSNGGSAQVPSA